jgi:protein O-GlcNAc transferase
VPLVTLQGDHFASRMSSSILSAAKLSELVTYTLNDYEALAVNLANQPQRLGKIREKLQSNRFRLPLFDTRRFVNNLEQAFRKMVEANQLGLKPKKINMGKNVG